MSDTPDSEKLKNRINQMRGRIESLRGLCKTAVGYLRDENAEKQARKIANSIGDMEPPLGEEHMKLVDNVTVLPVITTLDLDVERVLQAAIEAKPKSVWIIGEDSNGQLYFASSQSDGGTALWWMEKAKKVLMEVADDGV